MQAFMRSIKSTNNVRDVEVKKSITTQLSESIKDLQLSAINESVSGLNDDAKNSLCSAVEAIFLHGLRDSLAHRFRKALADIDQPPEPNFWSPLMVISHQQMITQINKLSQITSEIGQCRAWVRIALNESMLSSYLMIIRQELNALKPYYNVYAYIRDSELLEVTQKLIEGVEGIKLELPINSSLLNSWPVPTLLLTGIWAPTLRTCPIASGVDIAQALNATSSINPETSSINSVVSQASSIGQVVSLNQDEALKIILAKHSSSQENLIIKTPTTNSILENSKLAETPKSKPIEVSSKGNSISLGESGWSIGDNHINVESHLNEDEENENISDNTQEAELTESRKSLEKSYNAVIDTAKQLASTPDFRNFWKMDKEETKNETKESPVVSPVPKELVHPRQKPLRLIDQVANIAREKGLDNQNYECVGCRESLNFTLKPIVCGFTGEYFCDTCMAPEAIPIPARIIHNWDFTKYPISQRAYDCIQEIKDHPTIDFKAANPYIYTAIPEMAKIQLIRNQLNYLRAYMYTCREPIIEQLHKMMWPREYMYAHIHQYSISDLLEIKEGTLIPQLEKVVAFGIDHVLNCWLCSQKGFVCENCKNSKTLFPFDTENIYRCNSCCGIFHKQCMNVTKPCPKCKRRKERSDLLVLDATID